MPLDVGFVQGSVHHLEEPLRAAAREARWRDGDEMAGQHGHQLGRLVSAADALGVETIEEFEEAISPDDGAVAFLRDVNDYALLHGGNAFAVPYDVALALLLRARGSDMNLVHEAWHFGSEGLNLAVNAALEKAQSRA